MINTIESNKLLAEFMGMKLHDINEPDGFWTNNIKTHKFDNVMNLQFDTDWSWLMEVVEKIESFGVNEIMGRKLYSRFEIKHNRIQLYWSKDNNYQIQIETLQDWQEGYIHSGYKNYRRVGINENTTKLEAIYLVCVEFVKWYNNQK
jgi:hypothetical protein